VPSLGDSSAAIIAEGNGSDDPAYDHLSALFETVTGSYEESSVEILKIENGKNITIEQREAVASEGSPADPLVSWGLQGYSESHVIVFAEIDDAYKKLGVFLCEMEHQM